MQQRPPATFPLSNLLLFVVLSMAVVVGWTMLGRHFNPPQAQRPGAAEGEGAKDKAAEKLAAKAPDKKPAEKVPPGKSAPEKPPAGKPEPGKPAPKVAEKPPAKPAPQPKVEPQWLTLGSADPDKSNAYRMLVTLSNQGAALARIELSSPRYRHFMAARRNADGSLDPSSTLEDRSGYLGHVAMEDDGLGRGCRVDVVGAGTPADKAGLRPGDVITAVKLRKETRKITGRSDLQAALAATKPEQAVALTVMRGDEEKKLSATLIRPPLEVVRPEGSDPLSLLTTLQRIDGDEIKEDDPAKAELEGELAGVALRNAHWEVVKADQEQAVFRRRLPDKGIEITKTYRLVKVPADQLANADYAGYHLDLEIGVRNLADEAHTVAYMLDGPNGLPTEGWWYASKVGRDGVLFSSLTGLRDVVVSRDRQPLQMITCSNISDGKLGVSWKDQTITYAGVDAQYFSAVLIPQDGPEDAPEETPSKVAGGYPLRVGPVDKELKILTNTSFRLISSPKTLSKRGEKGDHFSHRFRLFAGPKKPDLLAQSEYRLGDLLYYGWFGWVAEPMLWVLHHIYDVVRNYGVAIILLTVLVRLCMFPVSRKQALSAQKMQQLQPEIKRIQEKYKDPQARMKAQQELYRKHNFNPLGGCLLLFIQLPIFVGLYRSLMVDVELRDAPLVSEAIRWCSNLSAPDMLINWFSVMPSYINNGIGTFALGPYFNLLPILTIVLFIWQQKMVMPPAADEQAAMQQKIMKYMMVFMGILFYKVASGLCIYFIASSLWGLAERKVLPKTLGSSAAKEPEDRPARRGWFASPSSNHDGAAARKKKRKRK